jgi:hypothetical protein
MNPQRYWVFGLCPSSGFFLNNNEKTQRFGNWICFRPKGPNRVGVFPHLMVAVVVVGVVMIKKNRASCHDNGYPVFFAEAILRFQYFDKDVPNYVLNLDMYKHILVLSLFRI